MSHFTQVGPPEFEIWAGDAHCVVDPPTFEQLTAQMRPLRGIHRDKRHIGARPVAALGLQVISFVAVTIAPRHVLALRSFIGHGDDAPIPPEEIFDAVMGLGPWQPLLCCCQLGQNRSTALAACAIIDRHYGGRGELVDADQVIAEVEAARTPDLAAIGRSAAHVSPQMRQNVRSFAAYMVSQHRPATRGDSRKRVRVIEVTACD